MRQFELAITWWLWWLEKRGLVEQLPFGMIWAIVLRTFRVKGRPALGLPSMVAFGVDHFFIPCC